MFGDDPDCAEMPEQSGCPCRFRSSLCHYSTDNPSRGNEIIEVQCVHCRGMNDNSPHSTGISAVEALLATIMPRGVYRRTQMPLRLGDRSMPEPDIAIVEGSFRDFEKNHPTTATLVVEVSDTTLHFDQSEKLSLYASANVTEYWILDLNSRKLEVYRIPDRSIGRYLQKRILSENDFVSPAFAPGCEISIEDLLPVASSD